MARIIVTGGAGFIGSHLCEALLRKGHDVVALDNFDDFYDPAVKRRNLREAQESDQFTLIEGDIRDEGVVKEVVQPGTHAIVHLAARAGVRPSIEDPLLYQDVNVRGTMVLLEACRSVESCKFIFASSSSVYGNRTEGPFRESDRVDDPISPYAATKKAGELLAHAYHHLFKFPVACLRFFTVFGPRQRPDLAIHKFARLILAGKPLPVFGDGSMRRDFTYVEDTVDGIIRAIDQCEGYHIYNLGNASPVSVSELVAALEKALGKKAMIETKPLQPGDVQQTHADVSLACRELGYKPKTDLQSGLAQFAAWLEQS